MNDPSIPDPTGVCFYFALPRELRDMIHTYALTYDGGLICTHVLEENKDPDDDFLPTLLASHTPDHTLAVSSSDRYDPNPLRHVRHQTRNETQGLLLKSNTITFRPDTLQSHRPIDHDEADYANDMEGEDVRILLNTFYNECSTVNKMRLRKVIIHAAQDALTQPSEMLRTLKKHAEWYHHLTHITFILRFVLGSARGYAANTRALSITCRGESPVSWPNDEMYEKCREWLCDVSSISMWQWTAVPRNMRFSLQEVFPEEEVRRVVEDRCKEKEGECTFEEDMRAAREVFEEGI